MNNFQPISHNNLLHKLSLIFDSKWKIKIGTAPAHSLRIKNGWMVRV